jgi:hypothetical protein
LYVRPCGPAFERFFAPTGVDVEMNHRVNFLEEALMHRISRRVRVALAASVAVLTGTLAACYPGSISDVGEADLVVTVYDTAFDFSSATTYFMPDTIIRVGEGDESDIDRSYDAQLLAKVASELAAAGYTRLSDTSGSAPDVFVAVGANSSTYSWWVGGCYWCYYPGYPGYIPGWGGGYYPGYPWYGYGGSYSTGSLGIVMVDAGPTVGEEIPARWGVVINGLLSSSSATTAARALSLIEQAFDQSPYLAN